MSLIDSSSTSKYLLYAIGEITLVVIGILIALQINNWNEWKKDRIIEKEVLQDILANLERNNDLILESLELVDQFDESADIVLDAMRNKIPYTDTLAKHFFSTTRTGGLLFPLSAEGYESLKNEGFSIIRSGVLKDRILELFEVSYKKIMNIAQWTMNTAEGNENFVNTLFRQESGERLVPISYDQLIQNDQFYTIVVNTKDSRRGFLKREVIRFLQKNESLILLVKEEL